MFWMFEGYQRSQYSQSVRRENENILEEKIRSSQGYITYELAVIVRTLDFALSKLESHRRILNRNVNIPDLPFKRMTLGIMCTGVNNFVIQNPKNRDLKMIVYSQNDLIILVSEFAPHCELPIVVKGITIHQSVDINNLRFDSAFFLISRYHIFILLKQL